MTREGKLLFKYKRPGQRVIVNAAGHMMVRPTHIEASAQKTVGGVCVTAHEPGMTGLSKSHASHASHLSLRGPLKVYAFAPGVPCASTLAAVCLGWCASDGRGASRGRK